MRAASWRFSLVLPGLYVQTTPASDTLEGFLTIIASDSILAGDERQRAASVFPRLRGGNLPAHPDSAQRCSLAEAGRPLGAEDRRRLRDRAQPVAGDLDPRRPGVLRRRPPHRAPEALRRATHQSIDDTVQERTGRRRPLTDQDRGHKCGAKTSLSSERSEGPFRFLKRPLASVSAG